MMKNIPFKIWGALPDRIREPLDILRRCHHWKKAGVLFIHVPKAAGVSVNRAIYGRPLGHFKAVNIRRVCPKTYNNLFTFGVVRHPVDRLYSAYRFAHGGGTNEMGMMDSSLYVSDLFSSFDKFVCEWLAKKNPNEIDGVFKPQYLYLCDDDNIIVDKVIKLDQIDDGMLDVSAVLGRKVVVGHHNRTNEEPLKIQSSETVSVINDFYHKDFETFNFNLDEIK